MWAVHLQQRLQRVETTIVIYNLQSFPVKSTLSRLSCSWRAGWRVSHSPHTVCVALLSFLLRWWGIPACRGTSVERGHTSQSQTQAGCKSAVYPHRYSLFHHFLCAVLICRHPFSFWLVAWVITVTFLFFFLSMFCKCHVPCSLNCAWGCKRWLDMSAWKEG